MKHRITTTTVKRLEYEDKDLMLGVMIKKLADKGYTLKGMPLLSDGLWTAEMERKDVLEA